MTTTAPVTPLGLGSNAGTDQLELGLAPATPPNRPKTPASPRPVRRPSSDPTRRPTRPRRFAVARWWFNQMREAVVAARDWPTTEIDEMTSTTGGVVLGSSTAQTTLDLVSPPTRLERRPLPLPLPLAA